MIPAEAVEAAAKAAAKDEDASNWHDESEHYRNGWRNRMQVGLEAAAPHMLAGALVPVAFKARARDMPSTCKWTSGCPQVNGHDGECTAQP